MKKQHLDKIISLCKRKGFVFPNSEIYGGLKASYDYGPLGVELKKSISELWWKEMTQSHQNIVGLDSAIMVHPDVWEASGHIANFNDPMTDNKDNKKRYRIDDLLSQQKSKVIDAICVALKMDSTNNDDIYNDIAHTLLSDGSKSDNVLQEAGVIGVELEVVPTKVAEVITKKVDIMTLSMGSGSGCDGQYLFANDVLGYTNGHIPRHARIYRDFKKEFAKLQKERVNAFKEFHNDTVNKKFNDPKITVGIDDKEFDNFLKLAEKY